MLQKQGSRVLLLIILSLGLLVTGCQSIEITKTASPTDAAAPPPPKAPAPTKSVEKAVDQSVKSADQPDKIVRRNDAGMLTVDKLTLEFGQIEPRAKVHGEYILTNTGKETLEIDKVGKSCGCTVPKLDTKILEPGQSVPLKITYNASDRPGKVKKNVWVTTKAPHMPEKITMTLTAEVIKFIETQPERLSLVIKDEPQTAKLIVESVDEQPFKVVGFNSTGGSITVHFDKDVKAIRHELTLEVDSAKLRKSIRGNLVIRLDHPKVKSVTVIYSAVRPFVAKPATKFFRNLQAGSTSEAVVTVVSSSSLPFELGDVTSDKGFVEVLGTEKTDDGYKVRFSLNVPEDKTTGRVRDYLKIAIKDHPNDTVTVTCYGRVK